MKVLVWCAAALLGTGCDSSDDKKTGDKAAPGAASLDELRDRALAAMKAGDADAYLELMASPAFMVKHCPEDPDFAALEETGTSAGRTEQRLSIRTALAQCGEDIDWPKATLHHVEGGEPKRKSGLTCKQAAHEREDLVAVFEVDRKTWAVKIANDVNVVADRYVVLGIPTCKQRGS